MTGKDLDFEFSEKPFPLGMGYDLVNNRSSFNDS